MLETRSELFASSILREEKKLREFGRLLTSMRIKAREATVPDCHRWIKQLHSLGRLVRCYTQNIDGLQTRDDNDMEDTLVELHGTNVYLKCHKCHQRPQQPTSEFDQELLKEGFAVCALCSVRPEVSGSDMKLRARAPGFLIPEVVFNEGSSIPSKNGKSLGRMKADDSDCDLLLILGTSLKTHGVAGLARDMANCVHRHGGVVVYVNSTSLSASSWSSYVDLHVRVDVQEWANDNLAQLQLVKAIALRSEITLKCSSTVKSVRGLPVIIAPYLVPNLEAEMNALGTDEPVETTLECTDPSGSSDAIAVDIEQNSTRVGGGVIFVLCYHSWALSEAHALKVLLTNECSIRGLRCVFRLCNVEQIHEDTNITPEWPEYQAILIFITRFGQVEKIRSSHSTGAEMDVYKILRNCFLLTWSLMTKAMWGAAIILGEDEVWAQEEMLRSMSMIKSELGVVPHALAGFGTKRLRLGGWASFIAKIVEALSFTEEYRTLDKLALDFWMATDDFFEHTDLKVWPESNPTYLLISAPFEQRPLGRPLPTIQSAGCCEPDSTKEWLITHNAADRRKLKKLCVTVQCSKCGYQSEIQTKSLKGWINHREHKYSVQVPCEI
ncbi:NAD-dependent histone deacetylase HST3 [Rhizoctonia solani]|uniref:NAD-dependent histone deacetylase HST3 n=1 Tax=Rhizoctonia solani TaxID=456999 RepID=A0A0K6G4K7_9AGAM|nr:NAD-dependent histone deacetylase HST3 [Rhizoctonia solani]